MEYKEVRKQIDAIVEAIGKGLYEVEYNEPENFYECTAPDGRKFFKFVDMDSARHGTDFGSCTVCVKDYTFSFDWGTGERESKFLEELEDSYELEDGSSVTREQLEQEIIDAFDERDNIFTGEYTDMDSQMDVYCSMYHVDPDEIEYFWGEDMDCPLDINDSWIEYTPPEKLGYGTVSYQGKKYFLVEETNIEDGEEVHAVLADSVPDDEGVLDTVLLTLEYEDDEPIVTYCEESEDLYHADEGGYLEEC